MSEHAKIAYWQEKLKDARRGEIGGYILIVSGGAAGMFLAFANYYFNGGSSSGYMSAEIITIILVVFGGAGVLWSHYGKAKATVQLGLIARGSLKCPGCGKELIPDAGLVFCPFCGKNIVG